MIITIKSNDEKEAERLAMLLINVATEAKKPVTVSKGKKIFGKYVKTVAIKEDESHD
jgi:hypothetical protein